MVNLEKCTFFKNKLKIFFITIPETKNNSINKSNNNSVSVITKNKKEEILQLIYFNFDTASIQLTLFIPRVCPKHPSWRKFS